MDELIDTLELIGYGDDQEMITWLQSHGVTTLGLSDKLLGELRVLVARRAVHEARKRQDN